VTIDLPYLPFYRSNVKYGSLIAMLLLMSTEKVICPYCQNEGKTSKVFLSSKPDLKIKVGGYWNEQGTFVMPEAALEPPFYICTNYPPHIWKTLKD
jgi:hypothetical protein